MCRTGRVNDDEVHYICREVGPHVAVSINVHQIRVIVTTDHVASSFLRKVTLKLHLNGEYTA